MEMIMKKSKNNELLSVDELADVKRELTKKVFESDNQWLIDDYFNDKKKFINRVDKSLDTLSSLSNPEIRLIAFICRLCKFDYEFVLFNM